MHMLVLIFVLEVVVTFSKQNKGHVLTHLPYTLICEVPQNSGGVPQDLLEMRRILFSQMNL